MEWNWFRRRDRTVWVGGGLLAACVVGYVLRRTGMSSGISQCWWLSETCAVDWSAWAAIATFAAAGIALVAAVLPIMEARRARRQIADSVLKVALASVTDQVLYLTIASRLLEGQRVHGALFRHAMANINAMDEKPIADVVPYFDALPVSVVDPLTYALVKLKRTKRVADMVKPSHPAHDRTEEAVVARMNVLEVVNALQKVRKAGADHFGDPLPDIDRSAIEGLVQDTRTRADAEVMGVARAADRS